ncbi:hypothetical protein RQP54_07765 [Curvibacter sp. APW13]|uniref:hypothetical protein n=1 Tax=Curvibacter sp. APW13 TaxID=3077236 RepID=UPI0028DD9AC7|nr:hypothetical protein [Curvibacter sp. APW13]MDT8990762.1 hypothetical protein [Curvibacter sp. APW13]
MAEYRIALGDIGAGRFAAHGDFRIWTDGDVLCYEVRGPFNLEWVRALGEARQRIVAQWRPQQRVGAIVHWRHSALMSPEALAAYEAGFAQFKQNARGAVALAWVCAEPVEGMGLLSQRFEALFAASQTDFGLFTDPVAARAWVDARVARARDNAQPASPTTVSR